MFWLPVTYSATLMTHLIRLRMVKVIAQPTLKTTLQMTNLIIQIRQKMIPILTIINQQRMMTRRIKRGSFVKTLISSARKYWPIVLPLALRSANLSPKIKGHLA